MPSILVNEAVEYFGPLLTEQSKIKREAVRRRKTHDERTIPTEELTECLAQGWELFERPVKRGVRIRRLKSIDERLENRFWLLLAKLGYPEINDGRKFNVVIDRKGAEPLRKQVDVFAQDDETVVIAECKASTRFVKRTLQKDIEEFANLKGPIADAIKKHYEGKKHKIIWLFVTENIIWSGPDRQRALGENIRIITERELRYYAQVADHLGRAARYQFLAEFLKDQKIPGLSGKTVPAIRGKLGGKTFYCFVTTPRELLKISFVNHRSLNDPEGAPTYQRLVSRTRMKQIGEFLKSGGYFPNNLLVNFTRDVRFERAAQEEISGVQFGRLSLPDRYRSAWIIDGQHRL